MIDFERRRIRSRIEAALLASCAGRTHAGLGEWKTETLASATGTIVELGPGTGPNLRYYPPGAKVIAIEPNPHFHDALRESAERCAVDLEVRSLRGEAIDVGDGEADAVVATLVLCGVDDPTAVVSEIRRVLRPDGVYLFHEHVAAPAGSRTERVQRVVQRPHAWMFNGCDVHRDTLSLLRTSGFSSLDVREIDDGIGSAWVRHQIVGTARR